MRRTLFWIGAAALLLGLTGCGKQTGDNPSESVAVTPSGIMTPTAEFTQVNAPFSAMTDYCWIEDTLLYRQDLTDGSDKSRHSLILQVNLDGSEEPRTVKQTNFDEEYLFLFFNDREDNLYFFGRRLSDEFFYLEKQNAAGEIIYSNYMGPDILSISSPGLLTSGFADSQGNVMLLSSTNGSLYFFNASGEYVGKANTSLTQGKLLDAGDDGIYLWQHDYNSRDNTPLLQKIDMEHGSPANVQTLSLNAVSQDPVLSYNLFGGCEKGLLVSTPDALWQYDLPTGEAAMLLSWQDSNININGTHVEKLRFTDWSSDSLEGLEILMYDQASAIAEAAKIVYVDQAYLPEKKTILLGVSPYSNMESLILGFNRNSRKYRIEMLAYDNQMLMDAMMYGKEQIPDILDIQYIAPEFLVSKGLLEDLEPYFKKSNVVAKKDILPAIWEAGYTGDRFVAATLGFRIGTLDTCADSLSAQGWTSEQFFGLEQEYPNAPPMEYYTYYNVWNILMQTRLNDFVDLKNKSCNFDNTEFISLLKQINSLALQDPEQLNIPSSFMLDDIINALASGEYLLRSASYGSPYDYHTTMVKYKGRAKSVSYPTAEGKPWYRMNPTQQLAIYSNSSCKDGAWEFIEYLLSPEAQSWYGNSPKGFPVRKDSFEAYLERPFSLGMNFINDDTSEEEKEQLRYMAEHMYTTQIVSDSTIYAIIDEEIQAFTAGDKTAEETAKIMQNRVQLYLDEM